MTTNREAIAAILAANTPLKAARYAVDNPPAAEIARLLDEVVDLYDAIGEALALLNQRQSDRQVDAAIVVLYDAMKGTTMTTAPDPPPPPEPEDNPDKDNTPDNIGPQQL